MSNAHLEDVSKIDPNEVAPRDAVYADRAGDSAGPTGHPTSSGAHEGSASEMPTPTSDRDAGADSQDASSDRSGVPGWLFLVLLLAAAGLIGWQFQIKGELESQISGLESELRDTQALLGAHKSRLGEIRSGVQALSNQLSGLLVLVEADPAADVTLESETSRGEAASGTASEGAAQTQHEIPARLGR